MFLERKALHLVGEKGYRRWQVEEKTDPGESFLVNQEYFAVSF